MGTKESSVYRAVLIAALQSGYEIVGNSQLGFRLQSTVGFGHEQIAEFPLLVCEVEALLEAKVLRPAEQLSCEAGDWVLSTTEALETLP